MITRLAGKALGYVPKALGYLVKDIPKNELALRLGQYAIGGAMAGAYTPGDIGYKLIAGTAATVGGSLGGLALGKIGGKGLIGTGLDMVGSYGGDMAASMAAQEVMKAKSALSGEGYKTPYQKMSEEQQALLAQAIKQDVLSQYGMVVPGAPLQYAADPTMQVLGA